MTDFATKNALRVLALAMMLPGLGLIMPERAAQGMVVFYQPKDMRSMQMQNILTLTGGLMVFAASLGSPLTQKRTLQYSSIALLCGVFLFAVAADAADLPAEKKQLSSLVALTQLAALGMCLYACYFYPGAVAEKKKSAKAVEEDDFATKLCLRIGYTANFVTGLLAVIAPNMMHNTFTFGIGSTLGLRVYGTSLMFVALVSVAASRSEYASQKRALQYWSIAVILMIGMFAREIKENTLGDEVKPRVILMLLANVLSLGLAMWACYVYPTKGGAAPKKKRAVSTTPKKVKNADE